MCDTEGVRVQRASYFFNSKTVSEIASYVKPSSRKIIGNPERPDPRLAVNCGEEPDSCGSSCQNGSISPEGKALGVCICCQVQAAVCANSLPDSHSNLTALYLQLPRILVENQNSRVETTS
jgi:hypothetical protein